jgi:hypothetical protein
MAGLSRNLVSDSEPRTTTPYLPQTPGGNLWLAVDGIPAARDGAGALGPSAILRGRAFSALGQWCAQYIDRICQGDVGRQLGAW